MNLNLHRHDHLKHWRKLYNASSRCNAAFNSVVVKHKSHDQKIEAVATSNHPAAMAAAVHPGPPVGAAVAATEIREAEMMAAARHVPHHGPGVVVVPEPVYYVSVYAGLVLK